MSGSELIDLVIRSSNDKKYTLSVLASSRVSEIKDLLEAQTEIPADRQRLIFSGRVLKNEESLAFYKIKSGQTVHLVKGAAPPSSANSSQQNNRSGHNATAHPNTNNNGNATQTRHGGIPSNIAAGSGASNILADLTGARYAGLASLPDASMFGPDGGMGPPMDMDQIVQMLEDPSVRQAVQDSLSNPQYLDMMALQYTGDSSHFESMRTMMQSPEMQRLLTNPQLLRPMLQMVQTMNGGASYAGRGSGAFPMPGDASTGSADGAGGAQGQRTADSGPADAPVNPFAALLSAGAAGQGNPMSALLEGNQPADTRPPEERYEAQLRQLNELGFYDFDRNVRALRRAGGNVQGAVEALLDGKV